MEPSLHYPKAKDLFDEVPAAGEDILTRPTNEPSLEFLGVLARSPTPEEAITFGAYLLPRRKAVWWGHECVRSLIHLLTDQDLRMLQLAEGWVREPEEQQRIAAMNEAMAARQKSPGVWIALAAAWSGGSMVEPSLPKIPPPPYLTPRAVNGGILSALARVDVTHRATTLSHFVEMGMSLATR
jgi:hypothetical protein